MDDETHKASQSGRWKLITCSPPKIPEMTHRPQYRNRNIKAKSTDRRIDEAEEVMKPKSKEQVCEDGYRINTVST